MNRTMLISTLAIVALAALASPAAADPREYFYAGPGVFEPGHLVPDEGGPVTILVDGGDPNACGFPTYGTHGFVHHS